MTTMRIWFLVAAVLAVAAPASIVPASAGGDRDVLTGTVAYRERVALPPDAIVEVWMIDASPGMLTQAILAQTTIATQGRQVPIRFELRYERDRVLPDHHYVVKAVIKSQEQMLFASVDGQPVITQGHPNDVALSLRQVGAEQAAGSLWGTAWRLEDFGGFGVLDRAEATLEFLRPGKVAGNGSCNRFFGSATIAGESLSVGALGATRMACVEAVGNQEAKYLRALESAERFTLQGDTLLVFAKGMEKPLRFFRKDR